MIGQPGEASWGHEQREAHGHKRKFYTTQGDRGSLSWGRDEKHRAIAFLEGGITGRFENAPSLQPKTPCPVHMSGHVFIDCELIWR